MADAIGYRGLNGSVDRISEPQISLFEIGPETAPNVHTDEVVITAEQNNNTNYHTAPLILRNFTYRRGRV